MTSIFSNPAAQAAGAAAGYIAALLELLGDRDPIQVQSELVPDVRRLTGDLDAADLRRPEAPGKWSAAHVVEHLADQELVNAFRLRSIVAEDRPPLRGYDQDRWANSLRYGEAPLDEVLDELAALRARNLRLYAALGEEELDRVGLHAERGEESARRLRALTAAHDLLHRRQLARIRAALDRGEPAAGARFRSTREVAIHVFDVGRAEAFYARVLGARVVARREDSIELDTGALRLAVIRDASTPRSYIPSFAVADAAVARRQLEAAGCRTVDAGPRADAPYFCDPFGFVFDVVERR